MEAAPRGASDDGPLVAEGAAAWPGPPRASRRAAAHTRLNMTTAFVPPNPNEFDIA
jgi:hypothetical protein